MEIEYEEVTLATLGSGVAIEQFDNELKRVIENIADPNTPAKTTREIVLSVKIKPDEAREKASVDITTKSKIAPVKPYTSALVMGQTNNGFKAFENDPNAALLPFQKPNGENVMPIQKAK